MNIYDTYFNTEPVTGSSYIHTAEGNADALQGLVKGQIIEGVVTEVKDNVKIDFSGRELGFSKESVKDAVAGEVRRFEVLEASGDSIILKDLGSPAAVQPKGISFTTVDTGLTALVEGFKDTMDMDEKSEEEINNMTADDYVSLKREGFSIEDFKAERLARALARIKENRELVEVRIDAQTEAMKQKREAVENTAANNLADGSGRRRMIIEKLQNADIPVTRENVDAIEGAAVMAREAAVMSDNSFAYLIKNNMAPSAGNIYRAAHCGELKAVRLSQDAWSQLEKSVAVIVGSAAETVKASGISLPEESDARWLLEHEIPVTQENLIYKKQLENLKAAAVAAEDAGQGNEKVVEAAVRALKGGMKADEALLIDEASEELQRAEIYTRAAIKKAFAISDDAIKLEIRKNGAKALSIDSLSAAQELIDSEHASSQRELLQGGMSIEEISAKLKLEEIRLKLTVEAGRKLYVKGINVASEEITQVVDSLRELEREYFRRMAEETAAAAGEEELSLAAQVNDGIEALGKAPVALIGMTYRSSAVTLDSMIELGNELRVTALRAGEAYEAVGTAPRRDLGDSIQKAFRNVDDLLLQNDMELTDANRRAVRILGYNSIEITRDNIEDIKFYDSRVTHLIERMQPAVVMSLIRKGINPLNETVDSLTAVTEELFAKEGSSREEKYSEFLLRAESGKEITEQERAAYIGIYRLLYQIRKNDGAAIGAALKSGKTLTLENLLTEVRTASGRGIDAGIGEEEAFTAGTYESSITGQINEAFAYHSRLADDILEQTAPNVWRNALEAADFEKMSLEELSEKLKSADKYITDDYFEEYTAGLRDILTGAGAEKTILAAFDAAQSYRNIAAANSLWLGAGELRKEDGRRVDSGELEEFIEALGNKTETEAFYDTGLDRQTGELMRMFSGELTGTEASGILQQLDRYSLLRELGEKEHYSFSVGDDENTARINLTVIHNAEQAGSLTVEVRRQTGTVTASFSLNGKTVRGRISGSVSGETDLSDAAGRFEENLRGLGFESAGIRTISGAANEMYMQRTAELRSSSGGLSEPNTADTDDMYVIAKQFIKEFM